MPKIVHLVYFKSVSILFNYIIYFRIYLHIFKKLSSLLYIIYGPFTVILSRNGKAQCGIYYFKILVIVFINQATKFMPPIGTVIYYKNSKSIIKAIKFLLFILSSNQLQLKKKSTSNIILYSINSLKNSLAYSSKFISLIVIQLIFITALISQYFLYSFLLIKNHRFLYRLLQYFKVP